MHGERSLHEALNGHQSFPQSAWGDILSSANLGLHPLHPRDVGFEELSELAAR